ncbi:MAG: cupin domain-containing protein [Bacteroidales bacterium]|nr:cupin domain-containing protein [Bacteroidales bacterium]
MYQKLTDTGNARKLPIPQDAWLMFQAGNHEIIRLDLKPGECIEKHANDWRIIFYVLDGTGTLIIGDEEFYMKAHQSIAVRPGLMREWQNSGNETLKLLAIKTMES